MKLDDFIINRGRGPEIQGTRITVYDILDFVLAGWHRERIAAHFRIHPQEVEAAQEYIQERTLEVLREYIKILERSERGNPPELQAKLDASHEKFLQLVSRVNEAKARGETDVRGIIQDFREGRAREAANAKPHG